MSDGTQRASRAKTAQASSRNRSLAEQAISRASGNMSIAPRWLTVAHAILDNDGATWARIGEVTGMTKYEAASCFRRLLVATGLKRA
jgi:hypothetical protein